MAITVALLIEMIHPINIPEDLMSMNPVQPLLLSPRQKANIRLDGFEQFIINLSSSYTSDGYRLDDGRSTSPRPPALLWGDVFLRCFTRRFVAANSDNAEQCSVIDIIRLQQEWTSPLPTICHDQIEPWITIPTMLSPCCCG